MDAVPPAKRPRTENKQPSVPSAAPYRRGEIWLDDGSVVLVAEGVAFRVHQSILSRNSEVFRDMFTVPQPSDVELSDGCPVVQLSDSERDLAYILKVLFDGGNVCVSASSSFAPSLDIFASGYFGHNRKLPFKVVSAMLRLGTKYQILCLREDAIRRLEEVFPARLQDFRNDHTVSYGLGGKFDANGIELRGDDILAVINCARMCDVPHILPPAFYICAQLEPDNLVDGLKDEDGNLWKLSSTDLKKCLAGQLALRQASMSLARCAFVASPSSGCLHRAQCTRILQGVRDFKLIHVTADTKGLQGSRWLTDKLSSCIPCQTCFVAEYDAKRKVTWENLASYFQLETTT